LVAGGAAFSDLLPINQEVNAMLSEVPIMTDKIEAKDLDKEILRAAIIAEYDAINLYEQMAAATQDENIKKILLDIAREEKTHVGEFQALLLAKDKEHKKELQEGMEEVRELLGE
jgi:rubrerythrin